MIVLVRASSPAAAISDAGHAAVPHGEQMKASPAGNIPAGGSWLHNEHDGKAPVAGDAPAVTEPTYSFTAPHG